MAFERVDPDSGRYLPILYSEETPYWEAARNHKLVLQRCATCDRVWFPIGPVCAGCLSEALDWVELSGRGHVSSFVVYHKGWTPWLQARVPYAVAQVQLDEGPRLTTNIVDTPLDQIHVGMKVEATWEQVNDTVTLIQFRRAA